MSSDESLSIIQSLQTILADMKIERAARDEASKALRAAFLKARKEQRDYTLEGLKQSALIKQESKIIRNTIYKVVSDYPESKEGLELADELIAGEEETIRAIQKDRMKVIEIYRNNIPDQVTLLDGTYVPLSDYPAALARSLAEYEGREKILAKYAELRGKIKEFLVNPPKAADVKKVVVPQIEQINETIESEVPELDVPSENCIDAEIVEEKIAD